VGQWDFAKLIEKMNCFDNVLFQQNCLSLVDLQRK
jgi:hypothetical protein